MIHNKVRTILAGSAAFVVAIGSSFASAPAVFAQDTATTTQSYQVNLLALNNSGASGTATVKTEGNNATVTIEATGLSADRVHGALIYVGGTATCPAASADTNGDGYIDNKESESYIGVVKVSLTKDGDTSANSYLGYDRMPTANSDGNLSYNRTFELPSGVSAADLAQASIILQGQASLFDDKAYYDGSKRSELTDDHAFETTLPVACGSLASTPVGGAATGVGSLNGIESPAYIVAGAVAVLVATGLGLVARKQLV